MPLREPTFDSRTYREILNEALARIPAHNPEWTNFNDSDPGITLLQLFAFMTENIIYRSNLIPERNRKKFLRLLRIPMQGAEAARGLVQFSNPYGVREAAYMNLPSDRLLYAGDVPFRTEQSLQVLPVEAKLYYKYPLNTDDNEEIEDLYKQLYASYDLPDQQMEFYEPRSFSPSTSGSTLNTIDIGSATTTVDGSLWVALLARQVDKSESSEYNLKAVRAALVGKTLSLGIVPALGDDGCALYPRGPSNVSERPSLVFELPNTENNNATYNRLEPRTEINLLDQPGIVELVLPEASKLDNWNDLEPLEAGVGDYPPSLQDTNDQARLVTWIRIRSPEVNLANQQGGSRQLNIPLSWVGINATPIIQRAHIEAQQLPSGTGEPDQIATLINTPVILNSVQVRVNGELWERVDDLSASAPEVPVHSPRFASESAGKSLSENNKVAVYTVDRESGEIHFGDGLHGKRPPRGASIQATYDYGGGRQGSIGIGVINKGAPQGLQVINPVPTWGGEEGETVEQAEKRIPSVIRHRNRLVSKQDYIDITNNTPGVDMGRLDVLPLTHPDQPSQDSYGVVTLLVIPSRDPLQPEAPRPDSLFLETICQYLEPRRILTTELHVLGPTYIPIWFSMSVDVIPGRNAGAVLEGVRRSVGQFLSPLNGGFEGKGWPLEKAVEAAEIAATASRVSGISKVNQVRVGDTAGETEADILLENLELPRLMMLEVVTGTAPSIEEIQGQQAISGTPGSGEGEDGLRSLPIPVVPEEC